eukprot:GHVP01051666.1.p1 GENE.GHVP01051666.1~~GHVP01051666.1.p1  ORF type:complete len:180 (+),score=25.91 GHVP01051666.1:27-542(+)
MEFFKNVSDELANAFVGHHPNVENECQQSHGLSFRTDSGSESDGEPTGDFQPSWYSSSLQVSLSTPKVVVIRHNWAAKPLKTVRFGSEAETTDIQKILERITQNYDVKANLYCEIRDDKIIISWEKSNSQIGVNPLPVGDKKRYFWFMSKQQATNATVIWNVFKMIMNVQR